MEKPGELYPGSQATAASLLLLAHEYRRSADILLASGRKGIAASYAPFRLTAIHAIELYLNAFLLHSGETPERIRGLGHNLERRAERAAKKGLVFRQGTRAHMRSLSGAREYVVTRYALELLGSMSQLNRLTASLNDVAGKVCRQLEPPAA